MIGTELNPDHSFNKFVPEEIIAMQFEMHSLNF